MCGIVGSITNNPITENLIDQINGIQSHRGPDGVGQFISKTTSSKCITFLHQRLAIIDLHDGNQPMSSLDGNLTIVFNGEIFNHAKLRDELIAKGYRFRTDHSDTEVLLLMYQEYGIDMLKLLNGMFAFVIYDKEKDILFGARDHAGIKPLYFSNQNGNFYFASELKSILKFGLNQSIDMQSLSNYLSFQFVPAPKTIFEGISKLEAGHYFIYSIKKDSFQKNRYWNLVFNKTKKSISEWKEQILYQLENSVKLWSISDVEVGASLSGGLDSSSIVALYAKNSNKRIKTFSLGFEGEVSYLDERDLARLVAKKYNTEHYEFVLTENVLLDELDDMIYHLDEPYGGGLPSWYVYKMMQGKVKVALTGTGGDELFGNYNKAKIYHQNIIRKLHRAYSLGKSNFKEATKSFISAPNGYFYHRYFKGYEIQSILNDRSTTSPEVILENLISESNLKDYRDIVPYIDFQMQLSEEFLHVTDRFSMAHSIEARTPFLDPNMINLAFSIPPEVRMSFKDPKYLLRESVKNLLPNELLSAPKKGFIVPEDRWLRTILREQVEIFLGEDYLKKQGVFSSDIHKKYVVPHMNKTKNYHWQLWTLLMFQKWHERFKDIK